MEEQWSCGRILGMQLYHSGLEYERSHCVVTPGNFFTHQPSCCHCVYLTSVIPFHSQSIQFLMLIYFFITAERSCSWVSFSICSSKTECISVLWMQSFEISCSEILQSMIASRTTLYFWVVIVNWPCVSCHFKVLLQNMKFICLI